MDDEKPLKLLDEKKVPADVMAKVRAKEKAILDGSFTVKVAPPSGLLRASIRPRWASTMLRAIASPARMPFP